MADAVSVPSATASATNGLAGVVGLGMMGGGMAASLDAAGLLGGVVDVSSAVFDAHPALADRARANPAALAADVDVVFVVVVDRPQIEAVLFGPEGLAEADRPGLVVCLCSTISAGDVEEIAAAAEGTGLVVVDVGIAGGPDAAATGGLLTTVGADDATFARLGPCLDALSVRSIHAGPLGSGMKLKLVKNTLSYLVMCATHEALLLGEELGFPSSLVGEVARESNLLDHFFWFPVSRPSARPFDAEADPQQVAANRHFTDIAVKDLLAAAATADAVGMDHPVTDLATDLAPRWFLLPDA